MFGLFNKKKSETQQSTPTPRSAAPAATAPVAAAPAAGIAYYPKLIDELVQDHHQLQVLQERIKHGFDQRDLGMVARELGEFGALLRNHLLKENMRLYIYLQQRVAGDEVNTSLVRSFRKEMDGLARQALDFLEKYKAIETMPAMEVLNFVEELERIGNVVHGRMQREEQALYPLYAPAY